MTTPKRCVIWIAVSSEAQTGDERESLPDQLRRQQERADRNGWLVIDTIVVEGFSRRYYTFQEFAQAAEAAGHVDPMRMFSHWDNRDFDILSCRDLSRLGREQSILAEVISRTIDIGAVIMPLDEAPVDNTNYRMIGGIGGIMSAQHVDSLRRGRDMGMRARAGRGEQISRIVPQFYIKDATGKLQPDRERYQRLFDDVAELYLAGTSYEQLPRELAARGHVSPASGKPFNKVVWRRIMLTARTWGHGTFNQTGKKRGSSMKRVELWVTGRAEPPPDVYFKRDVCEPLWTGVQGDDMIDELERRYDGIRGASRPYDTYALSRICVCACCGRYMAIQIKHNPNVTHRYVVCHNGRLRQRDCTNPKSVRFEFVMQYIDRLIDDLKLRPGILLETPQTASRIPAIERDIERLTVRLDNLIDLIGDAPPSARSEYQAKIDAITAQRETLRAERVRAANSEREAEYTRRQRTAALDTLRTASIWDLPSTQANQILRKLLGNRRLACEDGDVIGLRDGDFR